MPYSEEKRLAIAMSRDIATRIVENARSTIPYDINIMDERGIVIASSDPRRIGVFHEIAHAILNGSSDVLEIVDAENLFGTKMGTNTILKYKHHRIGVLGITGHPDETRPFVNVLKLAVEAMIEFEFQQTAINQRMSQRNLFESGLMYGAVIDAVLIKWADALRIDTQLYRIALIVSIDRDISMQHRSSLMNLLTDSPRAGEQDIITQWNSSGFVIFKAIAPSAEACGEYREMITEYLDPFLCRLADAGIAVRVYVGSFCKNINRYHESYKRALWVFENCPEAQARIEFFYDYVGRWGQTFLPQQALSDMYRFFVAHCDERFIDQMVKTERALSECNYNFERASQKLFVHKNTLFAWMNNFRTFYHIDPVQSPTDREFWAQLCYYCTIQRQAH